MRRLLLVVLLCAACSGGGAETTPPDASTSTTTSTVPPTTSTTTTTSPTTTTSTTSTTTTTTLPASFVGYVGFGYSFSLPGDWQADPDFTAIGHGFIVSNTGVGLPPSRFSISFRLLSEPSTPSDFIAAELGDAAGGENFAVLNEGAGEIDGIDSRFAEYVETLFGFDHVRRIEAAVTGNRLIVFDLEAPVDVFETQAALVAITTGTFRLT